MKKKYTILAFIFVIIFADCRAQSSKDWKTVVDKDGNINLYDPLMQEFLESEEPHPTQESLDSILSITTRIRVMNAGMYGNELVALGKDESDPADVLLDISDEQKVTTFRKLFKIIENPDIVTHCMCVGWPTFEFYSGSHLIARISMHHGHSIRWVKWDSDADLKENVAVLDWLASNGVPKPKESYEAALARAAENRREHQKWLDSVPDCIHDRLAKINWSSVAPLNPTRATINELLIIMEKAIPDLEQRILLLFEWYGNGKGNWRHKYIREYVPALMLVAIDIADLIKVSKKPDLTEAQLEGVSRFFCYGASNVLGYPDGRHKEYRDVLKVPKELKERIRRHILKQKDDKKKHQMEKSLLFTENIESG